MINDEYEEISNDTHSLGVIVSIAEFDADGKPRHITPVVHEIDVKIGGGMTVGCVRFNEPVQYTATYRYIADVLRDIADDCEKGADESEGNTND